MRVNPEVEVLVGGFLREILHQLTFKSFPADFISKLNPPERKESVMQSKTTSEYLPLYKTINYFIVFV